MRDIINYSRHIVWGARCTDHIMSSRRLLIAESHKEKLPPVHEQPRKYLNPSHRLAYPSGVAFNPRKTVREVEMESRLRYLGRQTTRRRTGKSRACGARQEDRRPHIVGKQVA